MSLEISKMKAFAIIFVIILFIWIVEEKYIGKKDVKYPYIKTKPTLNVNLKGNSLNSKLDGKESVPEKKDSIRGIPTATNSTTSNPGMKEKTMTQPEATFLRAMEFIDKISSNGHLMEMSKVDFLQSSLAPKLRVKRERQRMDAETETKSVGSYSWEGEADEKIQGVDKEKSLIYEEDTQWALGEGGTSDSAANVTAEATSNNPATDSDTQENISTTENNKTKRDPNGSIILACLVFSVAIWLLGTLLRKNGCLEERPLGQRGNSRNDPSLL